MRILLIEDDFILGASLKTALVKHAYAVEWLRDGEAGLAATQSSDFAAILLDLNLPKLNGIGVLRALRTSGNHVPVLFVTAVDAIHQKVAGLDHGADDYIVKPFDLEELLARLRALIRRCESRVETTIKCGDIEVDPAAMVVRRHGMSVQLTAKEFNLLLLLAERSGRYVTKNDIEHALNDAGSATESNTTEVTVYNLRKKLGAASIKSIRGVGYMIER